MGFWTKSRLICNSFRDNAKASIREVARQTGLSKSSAHRLGQAMARRNGHPESSFWETEDGHRWCIRLVLAVLYIFGLKRGVGAATMRELFACLHLEQHVGCSPSTLRAVLDKLEHLTLETTARWEHEGLATGYSLAISKQLKTARQARSQAQGHLAKCQASGASETEIEAPQAVVAAREADVAHWQEVRDTYRGHLESVSFQVHPWRVTDSTSQRSHEVEARLTAEVAALHALLETQGLPVKKTGLDKVRTQLTSLAAVIDVWGHEVRQDVQHQIVLPPMWANWVEAHLLPLRYWEPQGSRTRGPRRKATLFEALEAVQAACEAHPLTAQLPPEVFGGWTAWAAEHAKTFQRASSAVKGRNGYLSQMHHHHRGVPKRRYKVWSALHTFECRASDGSTPASRFFRREFPHLFETVFAQIDALPRPRKRQPAMAISH